MWPCYVLIFSIFTYVLHINEFFIHPDSLFLNKYVLVLLTFKPVTVSICSCAETLSYFSDSFIILSSLLPSFHHLRLDFPRSDSRVCGRGFPSHCDGEVCFPRLEFCEEELAVCHLWHWRLRQLYDHHVAQCGGFLDETQLAC